MLAAGSIARRSDKRPGHELNSGIRVDVLFLDMLRYLGRNPGFCARNQEVSLPRQVGEQVGNEVAEHLRVVQDALAIAIDGRAQRIVGFALGVKLLAHLVFPPDMLLRVLGAAS